MANSKHIYRKGFAHDSEAERTADGFAKVGNIDKPGPTKVWVQEEGGTFYVYVELAGEMNPEEGLAATGFERVS